MKVIFQNYRSLMVILLLLILPIQIFGNWGIEVGRANEGDVAQLLVDWVAMKMAGTRIDRALQRTIAKERQLVLLGRPSNEASNAALIDDVYKVWVKDVMGPAQAIADNPAASCAEAKLASQRFLGMMRDRQLLGMGGDDSKAARDVEIMQLLDIIQGKVTQRCRDESLDECVKTGRYAGVIQGALGEDRVAQMHGGITDAETWAKDALGQCAIYDLHLTSSSQITDKMFMDRVLDLKIRLKPEEAGNDLPTKLYGEYRDSFITALVSLNCRVPGAQATCALKNDPANGFMARIDGMDLKHQEFYLDANDVTKVRAVGENKMSLEFGGVLLVNLQISPKPGQSFSVPFEPGGMAFYIAHYKDRFGTGRNIKIERNTVGVYPILFEFTYADQNKLGVSATDSTVFQLIHKPEPKPFPARAPGSPRKPLKQRTG
jgi:hypothetical protein